MVKKIKVKLAPCAELKIDMTDEMIRDYQECAREAEQERGEGLQQMQLG